jgi:Cu2+-exporting ATPase
VRAKAAEVVRPFRRNGKAVILLSDEHEAVQAVAGQLGIDYALGGQLPDMKLSYVRALQQGGAMVGDGVNDGAVLSGIGMAASSAVVVLNALRLKGKYEWKHRTC